MHKCAKWVHTKKHAKLQYTRYPEYDTTTQGRGGAGAYTS